MSTSVRRFGIGFAAGAVTAAVLNFLPFLLTRGAYHGDGFEIIGFPFAFRRLGGFAGVHEFHIVALIADIVLGVLIAVLVGYACTRVRPKIPHAGDVV